MAISIGGYSFEGPYRSTAMLRDQSGIYAISFEKGGLHYIIDVGESSQVKTRVEGHDRTGQWSRANQGGLLNVSVLYTPGKNDDARRGIEQHIRGQFSLPCGVR